MTEVRDLRELPIEALSTQEINSRIAIAQDAARELRAEEAELSKMIAALFNELRAREVPLSRA